MNSILNLWFIFFLLSFGQAATAQTFGHEILAANKEVKIPLDQIIGDWHSADSAAYKISFTNINNYSIDLDGIKHGVGNYNFRVEGDSVFVNGSASNWPPYYCSLRLLEDQQLEIAFYQLSSTTTTKVVYRR